MSAADASNGDSSSKLSLYRKNPPKFVYSGRKMDDIGLEEYEEELQRQAEEPEDRQEVEIALKEQPVNGDVNGDTNGVYNKFNGGIQEPEDEFVTETIEEEADFDAIVGPTKAINRARILNRRRASAAAAAAAATRKRPAEPSMEAMMPSTFNQEEVISLSSLDSEDFASTSSTTSSKTPDDFQLLLDDEESKPKTKQTKINGYFEKKAENLDKKKEITGKKEALDDNEAPTKTPAKETDADKDKHPEVQKLGQLAWARIGLSLFWPCAVTNDPDLDIWTQIAGAKNTLTQRQYHVQFFGKVQRAWVPQTNIMTYIGVEDFNEKAAKAKATAGKLATVARKKIIKTFFPTDKKAKGLWDAAVEGK